MTATEAKVGIEKYMPLRKFCKSSHVPERAIRHAIFNAKATGIVSSGALIRIGGRWYVDPDAFLEWAQKNTEQWLETQPEPVAK
jgi:hypothetical protein